MIKINVIRHDSKIKEISVKGHANSNEYGKDLVCAGVSAICVGGLNALTEENFDIHISEGDVEIRAIKDISNKDEIVLETILTQLKAVSEGQSKYVKISERNE